MASRRDLFRLTVLTVLVAALGSAAPGVPTGGFPQVGQQAPNFTLPSQDGTPVSLTDFRGKWVVLYFYPKDGTPGCTIEARNFQKDLAQYEQKHSVVVGISVDSEGSHKEFCAKQGLTFKLLADTDKKVVQEYGSLRNLVVLRIAERNTFLVDPSGKIAKVWKSVDPSRHSNEVLATLASLQKNQ